MLKTETTQYPDDLPSGAVPRNNFMLWMVIGYLFLFVFRPFEYWHFLATLRIERIYMIIMLIMMMFSKQTRYIPHVLNRLVIGFFLVMVAASIFAFSSDDAWPITFDYLKIIVFYFVIIMTIKDTDDLKTFILAYLVIMLMYFGKSSWEFFINGRYWWRMGIKRMGGIDITYSDPNYFAASIAYSLPFYWGMLKYKLQSRLMRLLLCVYGVLAVICIIYSGSRSGMVTALLFLILLWVGSENKFWGIVLLPLVLAGVWFSMPESYQIRFESMFIASEGVAEEAGQKGAYLSAQGRIAGFKTGVNTAMDYPLLGIGPGNFKYAWSGVTGEISGGSAHNLYGQVLGELGFIGSFVFSYFILMTLITHNSIRKKIIDDLSGGNLIEEDIKKKLLLLKTLSVASMQAIVLLLFNGNFGHNLYRYNFLWICAFAVLIKYFLDNKLFTRKRPI